MRTCADCRHYVPPEVLARGEPGGDRANGHKARRTRPLGLCRLASEQHDARVTVEDGSDYIHNLRTAPDFGCIAWSA